MAAYYFEGYQILAPFSISSRKIILSSETATGRIFRRAGEGQRWDLSFSVVTDTPQDLFIAMLENEVATKSMVMPQIKAVDDLVSPITGYPTSSFPSISGENSVIVNTTGLASYDTNKVIPKGAFIQFSNHTKIYTVMSEVVAGSSQVMTIYPDLQNDVPSGVSIRLPNTPIKPNFNYKRSIDRVTGISYSDGILVNSGSIELQEVI